MFVPGDINSSGENASVTYVQWILNVDAHTHLLTYDPEENNIAQRLCGALNLSEQDLLLLVSFLHQHTSNLFEPSQTDQTVVTFTLDVNNLSILYRATLLASCCHCSLAELFKLLQLVQGCVPSGSASNYTDLNLYSIDEVAHVLAQSQWIQSSGTTISSLYALMNQVQNTEQQSIYDSKQFTQLVTSFQSKVANSLCTTENLSKSKISTDVTTHLIGQFQQENLINSDGFTMLPEKPAADALWVPQQYPTIGAAIKAADDGNTIWVDVLPDGSPYSGEGNVGLEIAKSITIASVKGDNQTTISGAAGGKYAFLSIGKSKSVTLKGFTFYPL